MHDWRIWGVGEESFFNSLSLSLSLSLSNMERIVCTRTKSTYYIGHIVDLFHIEGTEILHQHDKDTPSVIIYDVVHCIVGIQFYKYGKLHRGDNKPASLLYGSNVTTIKWSQHGQLHRENDEPAQIDITPNTRSYRWYKYDKLHREDDKPAMVCKGPTRKTYEWCYNGLRHRENDQPAYINLSSDLNCYTWYKHDILHRDGIYPADIRETNTLTERVYYKYGDRHRLNGPAAFVFNKEDKNFLWCDFYLFDHPISELLDPEEPQEYFEDTRKTFNPFIGNRILQFISNMKLKMRLKKEQELLSITNILSNDSIDQLMSYIS